MNARASLALLIPLVLLAPPAGAQAPPAEPPAGQPAPALAGQDRMAALKQSIQASMAGVRHYEWVETTAVSIKGEQKSSKQSRCFYNADGKVQKVPMGDAPAPTKEKRGVRGRVVENKKEEISDSMKSAIALVKEYVPMDPARIQAAKDKGKVTVSEPDAQGRVKMVISDYLKPGDSLTVALEVPANRLAGLAVSSYTDKEKDAVLMNTTFAALADGTTYPARIVLDVKSQNLSVAITNGDYKKTSS
jgi:hypothetical protein